MEKENIDSIIQLFHQQFNEDVDEFVHLPQSGSAREYIRLINQNRSVLGVFNPDIKENLAFVEFCTHFFKKNIAVPEIFAFDKINKEIYLVQDLGDETLFYHINGLKEKGKFEDSAIGLYKPILKDLLRFQISGHEGLNYARCTPRDVFDTQSMLWDLNYFKYYFLRLAEIPFDEQKLEDDFQTLTDFLNKADKDFFMFRDFQSRNIMLHKQKYFYIDFQGGRRGPVFYDLASLLYDGKIGLPQHIKNQLAQYYLNEFKKEKQINEDEFYSFFNGFALIRILQAMGAYGFRGFYQKKRHFLQSIPFAFKNLNDLFTTFKLPVDISYLISVLHELKHSKRIQHIESHSNLKIILQSFSYKRGIPYDPNGNGGGYVFDCRALPNPGRYEKYKNLSGLDKEVIDFFKQYKDELDFFTDNAFHLISQSIDTYIDRNFSHLMICFGCTGGQHRSVFISEQIVRRINEKYPKVNLYTQHRESNSWKMNY